MEGYKIENKEVKRQVLGGITKISIKIKTVFFFLQITTL